MILTSCSPNLTDRLNSAAQTVGSNAVTPQQSEQPQECREDEPHASIRLGDEARTVLDRERKALDRANASKQRCYTFNKQRWAVLKGKGA